MNLGELIEAYRDEADDKEKPYFCSDARLIRYANEGQDEAARRAFLLADSTSELCTIAYAAEAQTVALDPRILEVRDAWIGGERVSVVTRDEMACYWPGWRDDSVRARPVRLITGVDTNKLHLYPRPATSGSIRLEVYRMPLCPMRDLKDCPEIRREAHPRLVDWMLHRAFGRRDADRFDPTLSAEALARFEAEFGKGHGLRNEEWSRSGSVSSPAPIA